MGVLIERRDAEKKRVTMREVAKRYRERQRAKKEGGVSQYLYWRLQVANKEITMLKSIIRALLRDGPDRDAGIAEARAVFSCHNEAAPELPAGEDEPF